MGCGASHNGRSEHYHDDRDSEVSADSSGSRASRRDSQGTTGVTSVQSTRGRVASSSVTTPRLMDNKAAYDPELAPQDAPTASNTGQQAEAAPNPDDFIFGDFKVDPKDAVRLKVERLNRIRRPSRNLADASGEGPKRRKSNELFILNDFVIQTLADDADAQQHYSYYHEIPVPQGFVKLMGLETTCLLGHPDRIKALVCARDEKSFLSVSVQDCVVAMSQLNNGEELNCFPGHTSPVVALSCSRDGKYFASSARDGSLTVWEYSFNREHSMKKQVRFFDGESTGGAVAIALAFSFDGRQVVAGCQDRLCRVWNIDKPAVAVTYDEHEGIVVGLASHPSEPIVASGSSDRTIHLWNVQTGEQRTVLKGHEGPVIAVTFTPDGEKVLANDDKTCKIWSVASGACTLTVTLDSLHKGRGVPTPQARPSSSDMALRYPAAYQRLQAALEGPNTVVARAAQSKNVIQRIVFTVSTLLPGVLSGSYFAVACTNRLVYIVSMATGREAGVVEAKAPVFTMSGGTQRVLLCGDIFGNVYRTTVRSAQDTGK